jgi:hypothetical protein
MKRTSRAVMIAALLGAVPASAYAQYFKGKTITMVINYGAGGNVDTEGRIFERHLGKHIEGKPNIIVNNVPGAGGLTAINQMGVGVGVKDPSTTLGFVTFNPMAILVDDPALRVKMDSFAMIAGIGGYYVAYARKDALPGAQRPQDIATAKQIHAAGYARSSVHDVRLRLMLDLMGSGYQVVTGFQSTGAVNLAIAQNEINFMLSTLPGYENQAVPNLIDTGIATPLWQIGSRNAEGKLTGSDKLEKSGVRFFEQAHVRDLVALLRFVFNPADTAAWGRIAVLLPKVGDKNAQKLHAAALDHARLMQQDFVDALATDDVASRVPRDAREEWPKFTASLRQVRDVMRTLKPHNAVEIALDGWYGDYLKGAYANYESRLDDLRSLVGFASRHEDMHELLAQVMLLGSETGDRSTDPTEDALRLTTVHQAKGLEYAAVFLIGLAEGSFPLRRAIEAGDVEEERRLFYVAVTRARDELYLCFPKLNTKGGPAMLQSPSRFLEELPPDLYQPLRPRRSLGW